MVAFEWTTPITNITISCVNTIGKGIVGHRVYSRRTTLGYFLVGEVSLRQSRWTWDPTNEFKLDKWRVVDKGPPTCGSTTLRSEADWNGGGRQCQVKAGGRQTTQAQDKEFSSWNKQNCYVALLGAVSVWRFWLVKPWRPESHNRWKTVSHLIRLEPVA